MLKWLEYFVWFLILLWYYIICRVILILFCDILEVDFCIVIVVFFLLWIMDNRNIKLFVNLEWFRFFVEEFYVNGGKKII